MRSRSAAAAALATACVMVTAAASVQAAAATPAKAPPPASALTAKEWFDKGTLHYKAGEFDLAVTAFERAWLLRPHSVHLYNIGLSYEGLGDAAKTIDYLERYLAAEPETPLRADVERRLAKMRAKVVPKTKGTPLGASEPAAARAPAPLAAPALTVHAEPVASPGGGGNKGVVLGVSLVAGAVAIAAAVVVVVLLARPTAVDRAVDSYPGLVLDRRDQ